MILVITVAFSFDIHSSNTGEAMSHFRLTDELDWDEHQTIEGGDPGSNFVLSLDPQDIARSLSCLPVHSVLGIPQDMVSVSYVALHSH